MKKYQVVIELMRYGFPVEIWADSEGEAERAALKVFCGNLDYYIGRSNLEVAEVTELKAKEATA